MNGNQDVFSEPELPPRKKIRGLYARHEDRYTRILRDLLAAKRTPPGERVVTAGAKTFIEKRAALQGETKQAGTIDALGKALFKPQNMLIGSGLLGLGALSSPLLERFGYGVRAGAFPDLYERLRMDEEAATSFAQNVGKETAKKTVGLFGDLLSRTLDMPGKFMQSRTQKGVFDQLRSEDEVLSQANPEELQEAYHTMARFAPTLATDANAVKTFLRESTLYGTGPNFMNIKQLAEAERAINPPPLVKVSK